MKKRLIALTAVLCLFILTACGSTPGGAPNVAPTDITLDVTELSLNVGESHTFTATITPDNATDKRVTYSTEGGAVEINGATVTAKSVGSAVVTAKTVNNITAECLVTVSPADDGEEHSRDGWVYYEDFSERRAVPRYFGSDMKGLSRAEIEDGALRITVINGGSDDHAFFTYAFKQNLPDQFVIESRVRSDSLAFANLFFLYDTTDNYSDMSTVAANVAMDKGAFKNNAGNGWNKSIIDYKTGEWYDVRMLVDTESSSYWFTVGQVVSGRMAFRNPGKTVHVLRFGSETAWADVSYAKIGVRAATGADFEALPAVLDYTNDFDGTAMPSDMTSSQQNGGNVDFSTDGQVTLETPTSGTVSVMKKFSGALTDCYEAEVRFKNQSSAANTFANVLFLRNTSLSGTSSYTVTLAVESGNLRYHNGTKWSTVTYDGGTIALIDDAWYTLKAVCDGSSKKYKIYITGENYINSAKGTVALGTEVFLGEYDFRNKNAGDPDAIEFAIGVGKAQTKFTVDKFSVRETESY